VKAKADYTILLDKEEFLKLCKPGEGADTCIWLVAGSEGFECRYYSRPTGLVSRWNQGSTVAKRNGCSEVRKLDLVMRYVEAETLADIVAGRSGDVPTYCTHCFRTNGEHDEGCPNSTR